MAHNRKEQENSTIFALLLFFVAICQSRQNRKGHYHDKIITSF
nr:MAG TPA: hypothetical protein [Caudoviricetes sp.]